MKYKQKKGSKFEDHAWCLDRLKDAQDADHDNRERAREAHLFVDKRNGQWEPNVYEKNDGKPRYTFDLTNPIIDQIAGDMEKSDFDIRITPAGGDATKKLALTYDGIVRNIENISGAKAIYNRSGRDMITSGLDGWRVVQKYVDGDTFDQDLVIEKVNNFLDRVWFGPHEEPDASDAQYCWVLTGLSPDDFEEKYPDRDASSIGQDKSTDSYFHRNDLVMVGEFLYLKDEERELALMSNGSVHEVDGGYESILDELAQSGVTEVRRRKRIKRCVYSRLFDVNGWLTPARETVFQNWIPVIPCYANFKVIEDKVTYWGAVEKLIDPQRVFNYSLSREIEEGALAPRAKYWMTLKQAAGHEDTLATMNTNTDPVQFFNPDAELPGPPMQNGGAQVNPGLRNISEAMRSIVTVTSGMFAANMGDNPGLQSGKAIEALQDRGDTGINKYTTAREISQRHTARILVNAIPRVYEPDRQVRLLKDDGSFEMAVIGQKVLDQQTGQLITLNDLSAGTYDVECSSGPSFKNRQNETVRAITEIGQIDPSIIELSSDVLLGNIPTPGMDQVAERKRMQLFMAGMIPDDQLTDAEREMKAQMAQQPPQEDPNMVLAKAEEAKAQADLVDAQTKQAQVQTDIQLKLKQIEIDTYNAETKRLEAQIAQAKAMADMKATGAKAAKDLADAEAQDIENDAVMSGISSLIERVGRG